MAAPPASARKVLNPTSQLAASLTGLFFSINEGKYHGAIAKASLPLFQGATITTGGALDVPRANIHQVVLTLPDSSGGSGSLTYSVRDGKITFIPTDDLIGTLDPLSGGAAVRFRFYIRVDYTASGGGQTYSPQNCTVGTPASPIELTLITGTTAPPSPGRPISGIPYDDSRGTLGLVDNAFGLPGSSGDCDPQLYGITFNGAFNQLVGLPSDPGRNLFFATETLNPVIRRGVRAVVAVAPATGRRSARVRLDASRSVAPAGVRSFAFDLDGNGTYDVTGTSPTASHVYTLGTHLARVRVTDRDGDADTALVVVRVLPVPVIGRLRVGRNRIRFVLNRPARVTFSVRQCLPAGGRRASRCLRTRRRGSFTRSGKKGSNAIAWSRRIQGRRLARGSYRLIAVAHAGGYASRSVHAGFTVRR